MYKTQIETYKIIANFIYLMGIMFLYIKQGSLALLYVGGATQVMLFVTQLFFGSLPEAIEYLYATRRKRGYVHDMKHIAPMTIVYVIGSIVLAAGVLVACDLCLHVHVAYPYASNILIGFALTIPLTGILQMLRGYIQTKYRSLVCGGTYVIQAVLTVILVMCSLESAVTYGEKVAALLQNEHLVFFYIGERVVLHYTVGMIVVTIICIVLLLMQPRTHVKILEYNAKDGRETSIHVLGSLMNLTLSRGVMAAAKHVPFLLIYKLGSEQILTGNRLIGHFYGFMLPSILMAVLVAKLAYLKLEAKCSKELRKKESRAQIYALKLMLVYAVYSSMFAVVVLLPSTTRILSILGFTKDVAVTQFYYASFLFAALFIPLTCVERILGIIGKQGITALIYIVSVVLSIAAIACTGIDATVNYIHVIGVIGVFYIMVTTLLWILLLNQYKISTATILPTLTYTVLCAGATIVIFSILSNWMVNTLGGLLVGFVNVVFGGITYTVLVLCFYVFTKKQAKLLPGAVIYVELMELMGRDV